MSGFATMLYKKHFHTIDEQGKEYFQIILDSARFMHEKLEDLLTYATLEEKGQVTEKVDLNKVVQSVINRLKHLIKETDSNIVVENKLPTVKGNSFHFNQIIQNLIHNAIKFRHEERLPVIKIVFREEEDNLVLSFHDNGIGIEDTFYDNIFKLFKRLDPKNYEGTGIGLAICQRVAEIYNGHLTVSSEFGKSTTFHLSLPKAIQS
jgi:light-regulated signal transduction histidine kinase (bacteriophytochrome)